MKTCTVCKENKELEAFHRKAMGKFGVDSVCKPCRASKHSERRTPEQAAKQNAQSREQRTNWSAHKRNTDQNFRLKGILRSRVTNALRGIGVKGGSAVKDLGCTVDELVLYLESKFTEGMTWENHKKTGWHIDHIIPLASFDLTDREQFLKACHYTNLQPLWAKDNWKKNRFYK